VQAYSHRVQAASTLCGIRPSTLPLNVVIPDTFDHDMHVVAVANVDNPDTFNDDTNVV
jgi:hypothetical protein